MKSLLFIVAFVCLTSSQVHSALEDPFLLVVKKSNVVKVKDGEEITVTYRIDNTGGSTAYDVFLTDESWSEETFDVIGNTSITWDKLERKVAPLAHSITLKSKKKTTFNSQPAVVKYRATTKPDLQTAYSNVIYNFEVLSDKPVESQWTVLQEIFERFWPLGASGIIVAFFVYLVTKPTKPRRLLKVGKKKH